MSDEWWDTQIYLLEMFITVIKGRCKACLLPCNEAANGQGHPERCECH